MVVLRQKTLPKQQRVRKLNGKIINNCERAVFSNASSSVAGIKNKGSRMVSVNPIQSITDKDNSTL